MTGKGRRRSAARWITSGLVGALAALGGSGCLYINVERGGGMSSRHMKVSTLGPGNLSETVSGDFLTSWQAAHAAIWDLNMTIVAESRTTDNGAIECVTGSHERIRIELNGKDARQTVVGVSWMAMEDRAVSRQVLERISTRVVAATLPSSPVNGTPVAVAPPAAP